MTRTNKDYAREELRARKNRVIGVGKRVFKKCADDKKMTCLSSMPFGVSGQITIDFYRVSLHLPLS
jgi:hypothetical protein